MQFVTGEMFLHCVPHRPATYNGLCAWHCASLYVLQGSCLHTMLLPYAIIGFLYMYYGLSAQSHTQMKLVRVWFKRTANLLTVKSGEDVPLGSLGCHTQKERVGSASTIETSQGDYSPTSQMWGLLALGLTNQALHHTFASIYPCHCYYQVMPVLEQKSVRSTISITRHIRRFRHFGMIFLITCLM